MWTPVMWRFRFLGSRAGSWPSKSLLPSVPSSPTSAEVGESRGEVSTDVQRVISALVDIQASNTSNFSGAVIFQFKPGSPPTAAEVGSASSSCIIHNRALHAKPWQASCIEIREFQRGEYRSHLGIDFGALRHGFRQEERAHDFEVVHYFETSVSEGLAGYQYVATRTSNGKLPGSCRNHSAEGGYGVWVVPLEEYIAFLRCINC